jgi:hypothetical protein
MAKGSKKPTTSEQKAAEEQKPSEELIPSGQIIYAEANLVGTGKLEASRPLLAEGGTSRETTKAKLKHHLEKAQDATDFLDHLDHTQSEPNVAAPPPPPPPSPPPTDTVALPGRPKVMSPIEAEAERRIREGEVVPTPKEFSRFGRDLSQWWEGVRGSRKAVKPRSIANNKKVRSMWKAELLRLHKTK